MKIRILVILLLIGMTMPRLARFGDTFTQGVNVALLDSGINTGVTGFYWNANIRVAGSPV